MRNGNGHSITIWVLLIKITVLQTVRLLDVMTVMPISSYSMKPCTLRKKENQLSGQEMLGGDTENS